MKRNLLWFQSVAFATLVFAGITTPLFAGNWDGDAPYNGGVTYFDWSSGLNFYGNSYPTWNSSTPLYFSYNNSGHITLNQNIGYQTVQSLIYESTFAGSTTVQGSDGFDLYWKVENLSSGSQTVNVPLIVQGTTFELNPISGNLIVGGGINNYLNRDLNVWGNNGKTLTLNSTFSGTASRLILNENSTVILNGVQSYTGQTWVKAGTMRLGASDRISDSSDLNLTGGTFDLNSFNEEVANLVNSSSGNITLGSGQFRVNQTSAATYSGIISGSSGTFVKKGTALLTLSGANSYTGQTYIDSGELRYNIAQDAGFTGIINVGATSGSDGAAVAIGTGGVTISNPINIRSGSSGTKSIVAQNSSGNATFGGDITMNTALTTSANAGGNLILAGTINNGGNNLTVVGANNTALNDIVSGGGKLIKQGGGVLTLTAVNSYGGNTEIDDGTLKIGTGGDITSSTKIYLGNGANAFSTVLDLAAAVDIDRGIQVNTSSGAGTRQVNVTAGSGTAVLGGAIDLGRALTINASSGGALNVNGAINTSFIGNNDLTVINSSAVALGGVISGSGKLIKQGSGVLTISNSGNSYTGNTEIDLGTLAVSGDIANGSATYIGNGGSGGNATLRLAANGVNLGGTVQVNTDPGSGTRTIDSTATSGNTTISGGLTVNKAVTIQANSGSALTISGNVTVNNSSVISVAGANDVTFSGNISGSGAQLTKSGSGQLTLSGINNYSGGTTLSGGTLAVTPGDSITSATTINSGTLVVNGTAGNVTVNGGFLKGTGTVGTLVINSGGAFSPGNSPGSENASATTWNGGGSYIWEFNDFDASQGADPGWDFLNITGGLTIGATSGNQFNLEITSLTQGNLPGLVHDFNATATQTWAIATASAGITGFAANKFNLDLTGFQNPYSGTWSVQTNGANTIELKYEGAPLVLAVPEPSMVALLSVGAITLYFRRRRTLRARQA